MSYHLEQIPKGVFGEVSKIEEELLELKDAIKQDNKIMVGCELSDLYGAVREYAKKHSLSMKDLEIMADATERAFKSGTRIDSSTSTQELPYYKTIRTYHYNNTVVCAMITQRNTMDIMVSINYNDSEDVGRCDIIKVKAPTIASIRGKLTVYNPTRPDGHCVVAIGSGIITQNINYITMYEGTNNNGTVCFINVEDHIFTKNMKVYDFDVSGLSGLDSMMIKAVEKISREFTK